jgi:hypothetical protein
MMNLSLTEKGTLSIFDSVLNELEFGKLIVLDSTRMCEVEIRSTQNIVVEATALPCLSRCLHCL